MGAGHCGGIGARGSRVAAMLLGLMLFAAACSDNHSGGSSDQVTPLLPDNFSFWDNPDNWPTSYGPAFADVFDRSDAIPALRGWAVRPLLLVGPRSASLHADPGRPLRQLRMRRDRLRSVLRPDDRYLELRRLPRNRRGVRRRRLALRRQSQPGAGVSAHQRRHVSCPVPT